MLVRLPTLVLVTLGLGFVAACGSKTFDSVESGGAAGKGGSDGGGNGGSGASDPKGGSSGSTSGSSGSGGSAGQGVGGTGRGGTANGGTGAGGGDVGGASGTGGSSGGASGRGGTGGAAAGSGGAGAGSGGAGAGSGGSNAGAGGAVAGAGGSLGGAGGCTGICPRVACQPPVTISVTAAGGIAALKGTVENNTTGAPLGDLSCYAGSQSPCTWTCQYVQFQIANGDYTIVLSAPGYETKSVDFTVEQPTDCGCCGCPCGFGYHGMTELEPDGSGTPACCSPLTDTINCGACGNACEAGQACSNGDCVDPA